MQLVINTSPKGSITFSSSYLSNSIAMPNHFFKLLEPLPIEKLRYIRQGNSLEIIIIKLR